MMKAIRLVAEQGPHRITFQEDAPLPVLHPGDALVRVLATGTTRNELDWWPTTHDQQGKSRLPSVPGHELCGIVESVNHGVTIVAPGDAVYGLTSFFRDGCAAEFVAVQATDLAPKPQRLTPVETAAVPLSGLTAWHAFFDHAQLQSGQRVLIHGGAGGVGTFAVQLARWKGAHVIATTGADSLELVRSLGAHEVIDYKAADFSTLVKDVDVVLDCVGGATQDKSWGVLKRGGVLVTIAGESVEQPDPAQGVKGIFFIVTPNREQLVSLAALLDQGQVKPVINNTLPLAQAEQAFEMGYQGGKQGKVVLEVAPE